MCTPNGFCEGIDVSAFYNLVTFAGKPDLGKGTLTEVQRRISACVSDADLQRVYGARVNRGKFGETRIVLDSRVSPYAYRLFPEAD